MRHIAFAFSLAACAPGAELSAPAAADGSPRAVVPVDATDAADSAEPAADPAADAGSDGPGGAPLRLDLDGDGALDGALGVPAAGDGAGAVRVRGADGAARWLFQGAGLSGVPRGGDALGAAVAGARLDDDGAADLVVGAPGDGGWGSVTLLHGGPGLFDGAPVREERVLGDDVGLPAGARFGQAVAAGDVDGDGITDVVVGAPLAPIAWGDGRGAVIVLHRDALGWTFSRLDPTGVDGGARLGAEARFGAFVAVEDVDGDGIGEVIVGEATDGGGRHVIRMAGR